jgi:hypothetical protein
MKPTVEAGTMLVRDEAILPESLQVDSEPYLKGWRLVRDLRNREMDRALREAGWVFFYMADEVHASVTGSDLEKATRRAVKKLLGYMDSDTLNCLEIGRVAVKRFLGIPYVAVSAHRRHIQKSMFLFRGKSESDRAQLAAASRET